jgi:hypothetical protein
MNPLNDEDGDTSNRVHEIVTRMVAANAKRDFMAGPYRCAGDDGKTAKLNGFLGGKILESNLHIAVANRMLNPSPGLVSQEVSRICNESHIGTKRMQSFIFPREIIHDMNAADCHASREITPSALYTSIKAVIKLIYESNEMTGAREVLGVCEAILNINPIRDTKAAEPPRNELRVLLSLPHAQATLPQELVLTRTSTPNANQDVRIDGRKRSEYFADRSASNPFMSMLIAL